MRTSTARTEKDVGAVLLLSRKRCKPMRGKSQLDSVILSPRFPGSSEGVI